MLTMNKTKISAISLSLTVLLVWGGGCANEHDKFVVVPDIKNGESIRSRSSYVLGLPEAESRILYSASMFETGSNDYYFFIKQDISENPRQPIWKVVRKYKAPRIKDEDYIYVGGDCRRNGQENPKIIALVPFQPNERLFEKVEKAWIINTESLTIESISPEGIVCVNLFYGM